MGAESQGEEDVEERPNRGRRMEGRCAGAQELGFPRPSAGPRGGALSPQAHGLASVVLSQLCGQPLCIHGHTGQPPNSYAVSRLPSL